MTQGTINDPTKSSYGISISEAPSEAHDAVRPRPRRRRSISPATAVQRRHVDDHGHEDHDHGRRPAGPPHQADRSGKRRAAPAFNATLNPDTGNSTATATAVDSNGNVYTVGTATGNFGNELNQGTQDVVLTKYDSAGNLQWSKLLGSAGSADSYSLAVDASNNSSSPVRPRPIFRPPASPTATPTASSPNTTTTAIRAGSNRSRPWPTMRPARSASMPAAISISADRSPASSVQRPDQQWRRGRLCRQARFQGQHRLRAADRHQRRRQRGARPRSPPTAASMSPASQNGHAILTKYANGDATSARGVAGGSGRAAERRLDRRARGVGSGKVYLSGTSSNGALTSGGQASVVGAALGRARRLRRRLHRCRRHRQRRYRQLCRHRLDRQGRQASRSIRRARFISRARPRAPLPGRRAMSRARRTPSSRRWIRQRQCELDAPIWRRQRHLDRRRHRHRHHRVVAFWTRSACRAAPSTSTSRST